MVRDISSSEGSFRVTISNPSRIRLLSTLTCSDSLPSLPLQSPTLCFTVNITTMVRKQQLPDFPGIFKQKQNCYFTLLP